MREKICFGGTFNPIHHGHLICARAAAEQTGARTVVIFPTGNPAHKSSQTDLATVEHRIQMCRLAIAGNPLFELDDRECRRTGPTYTIDTARDLKREGWKEIVWLIGGDMLNSLPTWREPQALLKEVQFRVMARPGSPPAWDRLPPAFQSLKQSAIEVPQIDVSATEIRRRIKAGLPIDFLCPPAVVRYIADHKLYQT